MKIKPKTVLFAVSLFFNAVFIFLLSLSLFKNNSFMAYYKEDGYIAMAAVASVPYSGSASVTFGVIEISLSPGQKAFLQYSVSSPDLAQGNLLISALYDLQIISVKETGYGIEITALSPGTTVMQTLSNTGIKDVAVITVK